MFNRLLELKSVFDKIEIYKPTKNIGLRSLKNLGVWLVGYTLCDEQKEVIDAIAQDVNKESLVISAEDLKKLVDELASPANLKTIIEDYEKASGKFEITVGDDNAKKKIIDKIKDEKAFLAQYVKVDPDQQGIAFLMNNEMAFSWSNESGDKKCFELGQGQFNSNRIAYLEANQADHNVMYRLTEFNGKLFHVLRLHAIIPDPNPEYSGVQSCGYLIEPVNSKDTIFLQADYLNIIKQSKFNDFNDRETYELIQKNRSLLTNLNVTNLPVLKKDDKINFDIRAKFPELLGALKTTEERLGIYEYFVHKTLCGTYIDQEYIKLRYKGTRELTYNAKGGIIKNKEEMDFQLENCAWLACNVQLDYSIAGAYMFVFAANFCDDYYPFLIADPTKDFTNTFPATAKYPARAELEAKVNASISRNESPAAVNVAKNSAPQNKILMAITESLQSSYERKYKYTFNDFSAYYNATGDAKETGKADAISSHTDFFEQCMFYNAGLLEDLHHINKNMISHYGYFEVASDIERGDNKHEWLKFYFGSAKESESSAFRRLKKRVLQNVDYARLDRDLLGVVKSNEENAYFNHLLLDQEKAIHAFIKNPIFVAQYLIDHAIKWEDQEAIKEAANYLIKEIQGFRNLRNGVSRELINTLEKGLIKLGASLNNHADVSKGISDCPSASPLNANSMDASLKEKVLSSNPILCPKHMLFKDKDGNVYKQISTPCFQPPKA